MDAKREKALMAELGRARYDSLDEAGKQQIDAARAADARFAAAYKREEEVSHAWIKYLGALDRETSDALCLDAEKYSAVSRLFASVFGTEKQGEYEKMSVDELFAIAAERDRAALSEAE